MLHNATVTHNTTATISIQGIDIEVHLDVFGLAAHNIILGLL
jgi:hypothetical protein